MMEVSYKGKKYMHISDFSKLTNRSIDTIKHTIFYAKKTSKKPPFKTIKLKAGHWIYTKEIDKKHSGV